MTFGCLNKGVANKVDLVFAHTSETAPTTRELEESTVITRSGMAASDDEAEKRKKIFQELYPLLNAAISLPSQAKRGSQTNMPTSS